MKGIAIPYVVKLIELILVVVVIGVVLFLTVPSVSGWIKSYVLNPLSGQGVPLGTEEAVTLEVAVKCSYYRCFDGCGNDRVKNIDIGTKNCDKDYCVPFQQNGRVCGDNARNNPIKAILLKDQTLDKSKIKREKENLGFCIITSNGCSPQKGNGWIYIEKDATTEKAWEEDKCVTIPIIGEVTGYSRIVINAGRYDVWTNDAYGTGVCLSQ